MDDRQKQQHYSEAMKSYAAMINQAADSRGYVERLIKGENLPAFDQALRNHIEQFFDDTGPQLRKDR